MVGKPGRSGRPKGSLSWTRNVIARAGHHLNALIEMWLGGVPIQTFDQLLLPPTERRTKVPPDIKLALAEFAIDHVMALDRAVIPEHRPGRPDVYAVIEWARRRAPDSTLRHQRRRAK